MTPFGAKVRELRGAKNITLKTMAKDLHISSAYLSALEHGKRGRPSPGLVMEICGYLGLIWDDAEAMKELAALSQPKILVDTSGLSPKATELANRLAREIGEMSEEQIETLLNVLKE
ncbi:MAG: transcriptional regulator [Alphaproteobacteria bacterium RIFOXYD12_FULL_60_8]|nr:MAG: transcriptional regulator [Alphaproteobacteria bacterium RIFOXYD12_FULL_60_8]